MVYVEGEKKMQLFILAITIRFNKENSLKNKCYYFRNYSIQIK